MLSIENLSFAYTDDPVINNICFNATQGQNIAILGESGCGKSTLLKLIYGLLDADNGQIFFDQCEVFGPKMNLIPGYYDMKYLAQDFDLMPYTTVAENVGQFISNIHPEKKQQRIHELLETVEMVEFADTKTRYLSGGQMQRVAIARVLAHEPKMLLLDEPFSHIDNFRKNALRRNLFAYLKNQNITCLVATHDSTDALSFSDKTIVIKNGIIIQEDNSQSIYRNPINKYVGSLFGEISEIPKHIFDENAATDQILLCYPHQLKISDQGKLKANVRKSYFKGSHYLVKAVFNKKIVFFEHQTELDFNQEVLLQYNF
jgi:ABC-type Fe3+/spermidine/putrescine transport system ATPase subunit